VEPDESGLNGRETERWLCRELFRVMCQQPRAVGVPFCGNVGSEAVRDYHCVVTLCCAAG
jgi:hypothetical protein